MYKLRTALEKENINLQFPHFSPDIHTITRIEPSACKVACPAGVQVKAYIGLIIAGKFQEALDLIKEDNPLPGICGRVCTHPCEYECNRRKVDEAVAICALKRFVADWELKKGKKREEPIKRTKKEEVAIIGSGPAGLTCANDLIRKGYGVTIFEKLSSPGGMLTWAIPAYRLPRDIINTEIDAIKDLGVEIKTGVEVGKDISLEDLKKEGFGAFFIAIGAHKGLKLNIPGEEDYEGFDDCIDFLGRVSSGDNKRPGRRVIIIGGGNSAIDSARTAIRLGSDEVYIVYRRSRKEMPANTDEIEAAEKEGVKIRYLASPVKILGENGKVMGMECIKMRLGEPDASGRRRPLPLEGTEFEIEADIIIPAISQKPDLTVLPNKHEFDLTKWNTFEVDPLTFQTNINGFFAGGDAVLGPSTVIDAIAHGHSAAVSIDRYLNKIDLKKNRTKPESMKEWGFGLEIEDEPHMKRTPIPKLPISKRVKSFDEVDQCFTEEQAIAEAKRCLRCGSCSECQECVSGCSRRLVMMSFPHEKVEEIGRNPEFILRVPANPSKLPMDDRTKESIINWKDEEERKHTLSLTVEPIVCTVERNMCRGCGDCKEACKYEAIFMRPAKDGNLVAEVNETLCKGCGTCVAVCKTGAMTENHFDEKRLDQMIDNCLLEE
jgi:heterodisulfide reductase subunit A